MSGTDDGKDDGGQINLQEEVDAFVEGAAGLFDSLRDVFSKSREDILRGARMGKARIDVYQLRKDRELLLQQLGEETWALLASGALAHGGLAETAAKISSVDSQIDAFEAELGDLGAESPAEAPANEAPASKATEPDAAEPAPAKEAPAKKASAKKKAPAKAKPAAKKTQSKKKPPAKKKL